MKSSLTAPIIAILWLDPRVCKASPEVIIPDCAADMQCYTLFNNAKKESSTGNVNASLELYKKAYARRSDPRLLYSIARVLHKQGECAEAINYYESFVVSQLKDDQQKRTASDYIEQCRAHSELAKIEGQNSPTNQPADPSGRIHSAQPGATARPLTDNTLPSPSPLTEDKLVQSRSIVTANVHTMADRAPATISESSVGNRESTRPLHSKAWFWVLLGGSVAALVGTTTAVILGTKSSGSSSMETISGRTLPDNTLVIAY